MPTMPTWLSDPESTTYLLLLVLLVVLSGIWFRNRNRAVGIAAAIVGALALTLLLCDHLVESPREEAVRKIEAMRVAFNAKNWNQFAEHVSPSFDSNGMSKAGLKSKFEFGTTFGTSISIWGLERDFVKSGTNTIELGFDAKAELAGAPPYPKHFRMVFVRDPDGQYRAQSFKTFNIVQKQVEEPLPGGP
jgi:hypothetical protein